MLIFRADGRSYKGPWKNGKQDGEGIFIDSHGQEKKGVWVMGRRTQWI